MFFKMVMLSYLVSTCQPKHSSYQYYSEDSSSSSESQVSYEQPKDYYYPIRPRSSEDCDCSCQSCDEPKICCQIFCNNCHQPGANDKIVYVPVPYPIVVNTHDNGKDTEVTTVVVPTTDYVTERPTTETTRPSPTIPEPTTTRVTTTETPSTSKSTITTSTVPNVTQSTTTQPYLRSDKSCVGDPSCHYLNEAQTDTLARLGLVAVPEKLVNRLISTLIREKEYSDESYRPFRKIDQSIYDAEKKNNIQYNNGENAEITQTTLPDYYDYNEQ